MNAALLTLVLLLQQVYTRADFVQAPGASLQARFDAAVQQGRRGGDDTFWVAYQFGVRDGVRVDARGGGLSIMRPVDGIEWIPEDRTPQRVGLFFMIRKSDGAIDHARILDLNSNYRFHDHRVYWAGESAAAESLGLLAGLLGNRETPSSMLMTAISIHDASEATPVLIKLVQQHPDPSIRKQAVSLLGQNRDPRALAFLEQQLKQN